MESFTYGSVRGAAGQPAAPTRKVTRAAARFERIFELKDRLAGQLSLTLAPLKKSLDLKDYK